MDLQDVHFHSTLNTMTLIFLSVSLVCLLLSIIIFRSFPSLHCQRVTIHTNLFLTLALNNIAWILWYNLGTYMC